MNGADPGNMTEKQDYINTEVKETLKSHAKHLQIANAEMGVIKLVVGEIKNDVRWLKKFFWGIATPLLTAIGAGIAYLIFKL